MKRMIFACAPLALLLSLAGPAAAAPGRVPAPPPAPGAPGAGPGHHRFQVFSMSMGKGRLGARVMDISSELRAHLGAPGDRGVLVDSVVPHSPADRAGVKAGDVLVEVDGRAATTAWDVISAMSGRKKGDGVQLSLVRDGKPLTLTAVLEDDPVDWNGLAGPGADPLDFQRAFDFGFGPGQDSRALQRQLDRAQKRIDQLERRLDRLERQRR